MLNPCANSTPLKQHNESDEINVVILSGDATSNESTEPHDIATHNVEISLTNKQQRISLNEKKAIEAISSQNAVSTHVEPLNHGDLLVSSSEQADSNNEETYFALSLVGILKRLPPQKRAIAKCHILNYLTELEYGSSSEHSS